MSAEKSQTRNRLSGQYDSPVEQGFAGRWFIKMGHAGFNSPVNNRLGYATKESALAAHERYNRRGQWEWR
jgi:hypothetical protein